MGCGPRHGGWPLRLVGYQSRRPWASQMAGVYPMLPATTSAGETGAAAR
jgi:hypothetical protein